MDWAATSKENDLESWLGRHKLSNRSEEHKSHLLDGTTLDTYALLRLFVSILSAQAWQHLGLRVKTGTDKTERDFGRARVVIDCIAFLVDKLETHVADQEKSEMRRLLADLQINFARLTAEK